MLEPESARRLQIPTSLYGRQRELGVLLDALGRLGHGGSHPILLQGASGVGKTRLLHSFTTRVTDKHGRVLFLTAEKFAARTPFATLKGGMQELVARLVAEPPDEVAHLRARLLQAAGDAGQVLEEIIPTLGVLLGPSPPAPPLPPKQSADRLRTLLYRFFSALSRTTPLVVIVDDIQWLDESTANLLMSTLLSPDIKGSILFVASYRDDGPLLPDVDRLISRMTTGVDVATWRAEEVTAFVRDAIQRDIAANEADVIELVVAKTGGVALSIRLLVDSLHASGALWLDDATGTWRFDTEALRQLPVQDNVAAYLEQIVLSLPAPIRRLLSAAACIGERFDVSLLAELAELPVQDCLSLLRDPMAEGLILAPAADVAEQSALAFSHGRIRLCCYGLDPHVSAWHKRIAALLAQRNPGDTFTVLEHLNRCAPRDLSTEEQTDLIEANLRAARASIRSGAYRAARQMVAAAEQLLALRRDAMPLAAWQARVLGADIQFLSGSADDAIAAYEALFNPDETQPLRHLEGFAELLAALQSQYLYVLIFVGRYNQSMRMGGRFLAEVGLEVSSSPPADLAETLRRGDRLLPKIDVAPVAASGAPDGAAAIMQLAALATVAATLSPNP
ncbi:MAG TPA: AAA family ATPase, partial [Myxococcota bacterium]|nr:AAA family ATPase [Myxococcota bacterium]